MFEGPYFSDNIPSYYILCLTGSGKRGIPVYSVFDLESYHLDLCIKAVPVVFEFL